MLASFELIKKEEKAKKWKSKGATNYFLLDDRKRKTIQEIGL